ncbi:MAG: hypothetical protein ACOC23_08770, partial [Thermodesulfobacteriota bacterium]
NSNISLLPPVHSLVNLASNHGAVGISCRQSSNSAGGFTFVPQFASLAAAVRFGRAASALLPALIRKPSPGGEVVAVAGICAVRRVGSGAGALFFVSVPVAPWSVPAALPVVTLGSGAALVSALGTPEWAPRAPFYPPVPVSQSPRAIWVRSVVGVRRWVMRAAWHLRRAGRPRPVARAWRLYKAIS